MANPYGKMSVEELEEANRELMGDKESIRNEQRQLTEVLDRKLAEERAQTLVGNLSDDERRALAQVVSPGGIESEEK
jgi:ABC-type multidrug transport system ATPase subunit